MEHYFFGGEGGGWSIFWGMNFFSHLKVVHDLVWWAIALCEDFFKMSNKDSRKYLLEAFFPVASLSCFCSAVFALQ